MLTKERERGKVKCHRYWPTTGAWSFLAQYQIMLELVNVTEYPDYILREFNITHISVRYFLQLNYDSYTVGMHLVYHSYTSYG